MKVYKSKAIKFIIYCSFLLIIGIYSLINISDKSTKTINSKNYKGKALEWFIEDFKLISFDKNGKLSHVLDAQNAYKYQENNYIKLQLPYLKHFPTKDYNNIYDIKANDGFILNKASAIKARKNFSNTEVESLEFKGNVYITTPEIIAKSQSLRYNLENQLMQLSKNVETTYKKNS